jgi:hypothetical protein
MILASHAVIGVAAAKLAPVNPLLAFCLAFLSHFAADAIPHWEYKLSKSVDPKYSEGMSLNRDFFVDSVKVGSDILLGILLSYYIFSDVSIEILSLGIIGGILPDIFQFLYGKIKIQPLIIFKKFHDAVHSEKMDERMILGVSTQVLVILIIAFLN